MTFPNDLPARPFRPVNLAHCGLSGLWLKPRALWLRLNATDTLPGDMLAEECRVVLCFKLSVVINLYTGGQGDMTFSARSYRASRISRNLLLRLMWICLTALIDVLCGILRGEAYHCETAWKNHIAR